MENKHTFFSLDIRIPKDYINSESYMKKLNDNIDLILYSMQASNKYVYKIFQNDGSRLILLFKAITRKREGQLSKFCSRYFCDNVTFEVKDITRDTLIDTLSRARSNLKKFKIIEKFDVDTYDGSDIKIFNGKKNFYSWQKDIYDVIYNDD